jgi:hypothetical protein
MMGRYQSSKTIKGYWNKMKDSRAAGSREERDPGKSGVKKKGQGAGWMAHAIPGSTRAL